MRKSSNDYYACVPGEPSQHYFTNDDSNNPYPWFEPTHSPAWECFEFFDWDLGRVTWTRTIFLPDWANCGDVTFTNGHGRAFLWWNHVEGK